MGEGDKLPEILPPPRGIAPVKLWWWYVSPKTARNIRLAAATVPIGGAAYWFQNFLQLRGIVNLTASRIDLGLVTLCVLLAAYVLTEGIRFRWAWRIVFSVIILCAAFGLVWWAPKPQIHAASPQQLAQVQIVPELRINDAVTAVVHSTASVPAKPPQPHASRIGHRIASVKAAPIPATQPEEAAPQVHLPFDLNALPDFLRPQPLAPDLLPQPPSAVRAETPNGILEEIRTVLEKDRESEDMQGCPAGTSVELRMVGPNISYNLCVKQCFAEWKTVNPKSLDFGDLKVSQPFDDHRLAAVEIPCLHPDTLAGLCVKGEAGTFPANGCVKKKLKTDFYQSFWMTVHTDTVDPLVRLWKEFAQVGP
jgi:hypothetical protein